MPDTLTRQRPRRRETPRPPTRPSVEHERDVIARLAERGQQTVARLAELPGGTRALNAFNDLRNRVDELGKKVRGIDELQKRVAALEDEVAALKKKSSRASSLPTRSSPCG